MKFRWDGTKNLTNKNKHGIDSNLGIDPFDPKVIKYAFENRPEKKKIESYLERLEYDTLLKLEALMYFGRDDG